MALPDTYKQVEYIQSSGTQYIDTGFIPNSTSKVVFKISNFNINSSTQYIFCSYSTRGNNMFLLLGNSTWQGGTNGNLCFGSTETGLTSGNLGDGGMHTAELSSDGCYVDGTKIVSVSGTFSGVNSIVLFAGHNNTSIGYDKGSFKLYYFKIYDNGTLYRDLIPVIRKSGNKPGLYDLVNDVFYTNQGTGEFTYKEYAESGKIQKIYIGSQQVRPINKEFPFTYDFKNKSAASITADGWRIPGNTPSFNSSGMYYSSWSAGVVYDFKDGAFSNANKITGTLDFIITNSSKNGESLQLEPKGLSSGFWNNDYGWFNNHNYFEERFNGATTYGGIRSGYANGTYTEKVVYDLINKTVSYTGPTTSTRTLTDTQISQIRALCSVYILVADNGVTISNISIEVE